MRLISFQADDGPRVAVRRDAGCVDLQAADGSLPANLQDLLALDCEGWARVRDAARRGPLMSAPPARVLPPIARPEKIICIGLNYADHAAETNQPLPSEPVVFCKFATAIRGDGDPIVLPKVSAKVDYEAELVVVIGRPGHCIPQDRAYEHVAGYTCGDDVSARDWQLEKPGGQWLLGKTFDSFAPIGPELVTSDEIGDPGQLRISLRLNGRTMQDSSTRQLIFPVDRLIAHLSSVCTLHTGDLIFTGTPPGVGTARRPPVYLRPGDVVEVEIEKIGVLRNPVAADRS